MDLVIVIWRMSLEIQYFYFQGTQFDIRQLRQISIRHRIFTAECISKQLNRNQMTTVEYVKRMFWTCIFRFIYNRYKYYIAN